MYAIYNLTDNQVIKYRMLKVFSITLLHSKDNMNVVTCFLAKFNRA